MHLTLSYIVFACHQNDVCDNTIGSVYVGGYCGLNGSELCVFGKLCPVGFLVVRVELSTMFGCIVCSTPS